MHEPYKIFCFERFFLVIMTTVVLVSCHGNKNTEVDSVDTRINQKIDLINTDRSFAMMSKKEGMRDAFIEYLDSNGVMLRPQQLPIEGGDAIDYLIQQNDENYTLTWEPKNAVVAESGELGYTYGIYAMSAKKVDTTIYGTYTSVWKKQPDGKWKLVLHSWNEGLGE